jgi:hypothetical protein
LLGDLPFEFCEVEITYNLDLDSDSSSMSHLTIQPCLQVQFVQL